MADANVLYMVEQITIVGFILVTEAMCAGFANPAEMWSGLFRNPL